MNTNTTNMFGMKFQYFVNDDMARSSIGMNKEWEPHISSFVTLYNRFFKIKNIIDIGANFGYHSLLFSKEVSGNVYAFEPQTQNYELLQNNIKLNSISNIVSYNLACGDINCEIKMPIIENTQSSVNMGDFTPNILQNHSFSVTRSTPLDEIDFPQIDLIKIDVQGWEKKVLIGGHTLLKTHKPVLIVEFEYFQLEKTKTTCKELFDYIRNNNYYIFYLEQPAYPSDHVCVHVDKLDEFRIHFKDYIFNHTEDNNINHNVHCGVNEKISLINKTPRYA
jgi:FkbM family methyltransferase